MNAYITNVSVNSLFNIQIKDSGGRTHGFEDCVGFRGNDHSFAVYELCDDVLIPRGIFYNPQSVLMEPKDVSKMQEVARNRGSKAGH